jgi:hypothetical protein
MTQLKEATEALRAQIDQAVATNRASVGDSIEGRKSEVLAGNDYANATEDAKQSVVRSIELAISRVGGETQIALIRELGSSFEESIYPSLLDQLAASAQSGGGSGDGEQTPIRQTVSVKTISVPDAHGVLENVADVEQYLDALRTALLNALNDGKRIAL